MFQFKFKHKRNGVTTQVVVKVPKWLVRTLIAVIVLAIAPQALPLVIAV